MCPAGSCSDQVYLPLGVAEDDSLCDGECVIEVTEGVELPLLLLNCHKELLNPLQCKLITGEGGGGEGEREGKGERERVREREKDREREEREAIRELAACYQRLVGIFMISTPGEGGANRLTSILMGSVMNLCVISSMSWGSVALTNTTWTERAVGGSHQDNEKIREREVHLLE